MRKTTFLLYLFVLIGFNFFSSCENLQEDFNTRSYKNPIKIGVVGDITIGREVVENYFFDAQMAQSVPKYRGLEFSKAFITV